MAETALYLPIKHHLQKQGYDVKSEVRGCDVVARRENLTVIVELKTAFTLQLVYQAMDRLAMTDTVYVAVARPKRGFPADGLKLCKRVGIGVIVVSPSGSLDVLADPVPYKPRVNAKRHGLLLREFTKREGDPNLGGSNGKIMTSYRQDALKCVAHLRTHGASRVKDIKSASGVDRAAAILRDNHYGWFQRTTRGIYALVDINHP